MKTLTPIIFDMYGSLLDESIVYRNFYKYLAKKYKIKLSRGEFMRKFFQEQRRFIFANARKSFKEITLLALRKLIKKANAGDTNMLFDSYSAMTFPQGIPELLQKLSKQYVLCILTNTDND